MLKKAGYDGVMKYSGYRNNEGGLTSPWHISELLVFSPTQIKSAIANEGTFDPNNPSILKSFKELMVRALKHLPGQHDQREHGSWAHGSNAEDGQLVLAGFAPAYASKINDSGKVRKALVEALEPYEKALEIATEAREKAFQSVYNLPKEEGRATFLKAEAEYKRAHAAAREKRAAAIKILESDTPAEMNVGFGGYIPEELKGKIDVKPFSRDEMDYMFDNPIQAVSRMAPVLDGARVNFNPVNTRPFFNPEDSSIWINHVAPGNAHSESQTLRQMSHELGHWIEENIPNARMIASAFLNRRTKNTEGRIDPFTKEIFRPDHFIDEYMGKLYGGGVTEIISTGLAYLVTNPYALAKGDPEMFDLVLAIVQNIDDLATKESGSREKHLPGQHDQRDHGSWAHGPEGKDALYSRQGRPVVTAGQMTLEEAPPSSPRRSAAGVRSALVSQLKPEYDKLAALDKKTREMSKEARALRKAGGFSSNAYWDYKKRLYDHQAERAEQKLKLTKLESEVIKSLETETPASPEPNFEFTTRYMEGKWTPEAKWVDGVHDYSTDFTDTTIDYIKEQLGNVGKVASVIGDKPINVGVPTGFRAFYVEAYNALYVADTGTFYKRNKKYMDIQISHELGHWIEHNIDGARERVTAFFEKRTAGKKARPYKGREREMVIKDKFLEAYIGRVYDSGSTEIISMGLEYLFTNPYKLATGDPEMFDLVLSIVQGIPEK